MMEKDAKLPYVIQRLIKNMVAIRGGTFVMGANETMSDADRDQKPAHLVEVSDFSIGRFQVRQREWEAVMDCNPSYWKDYYLDELPVEQVSWNDCQEFITRLNKMTGMAFRLPTEAEWEFAALGGNNSHNFKFAGSDLPYNVAWCNYRDYYWSKKGNNTMSVGTKRPNELGLYDMSGNVAEWCSDWYGNYSEEKQTNPVGASCGIGRVCRGGGWYDDAERCSVKFRGVARPDFKSYALGLRLALS